MRCYLMCLYTCIFFARKRVGFSVGFKKHRFHEDSMFPSFFDFGDLEFCLRPTPTSLLAE